MNGAVGFGVFRVDGDEVARVRRQLFVGFGSCSAQEPADELVAVRLL